MKRIKLFLSIFFILILVEEIFQTTRFGNPIITWGRYRFTKKVVGRVKTWWKCAARKSNRCRCVAVTVNDRLVKLNEPSEPTFDLSQRGNLVVQIGPWRFHKHSAWGTKVRWTCIKRTNGCTAAITTVDNVIVKTLGKHNH